MSDVLKLLSYLLFPNDAGVSAQLSAGAGLFSGEFLALVLFALMGHDG